MTPKYLGLTTLLILIYSLCSSQNIVSSESSTESSITGKWITHDEQAVIEIYKDVDKFSGVIDSLLDSPHSESLIGLKILQDFTFHNNKYIGGTMYDPESKSSYKCKLWMMDENNLKVRDYCGLTYKTFTWKRLK